MPTDIVLAPTKPRYRVKAVSSPAIITKSEGDFRPGPYYLPYSGGWLGAVEGSFLNWWQMGEDVGGLGSSSAMASACVAAYAQTVAMCPGDHWKAKSNGGRERVTTSALSRWLKTPNAYQTISDFLLNGVTNLYDDGNMYALALRNSRYEIIELHLMNPRACNAVVASETGDVFYGLAGNPVIDRMIDYPLMVPARDVLHIRLNTSQHHPLRGESPLMSAARDVAVGNAMALQQLNFYINQARPGMVLATDMNLDKDQVQALRDRWDEQSRGLGRGGTPILTNGLKPVPLSSANAENSQLADIMKMSEQRVALAYRVPLQILGIGGAAFNTTESLMQSWLAGALGFALNHVEEAIGRLFGLAGQPDEYLELNTKVLLRSAFKDRVEGLVRGVQGGVFSPDEARETESLPRVKGGFGEEPRVQQQLVPLSAAAAIPAAPGPGAAPPAASIPTPPAKDPVSKADENQEEQQFVIERLQKLRRPLNFQRTE